MQRNRPFTGILPNEAAGAATRVPGLPFHAVIPCLRGPFRAFSAFSAFFLSTAAEQFPDPFEVEETTFGSTPGSPAPAKPQLTSLIARRTLSFLPAASNPNKGRENTKFEHLAKTKDLAAPHLHRRTLRAHRALKAHTFTRLARLPRPAVGPAVP
jgi:hypothetical protein